MELTFISWMFLLSNWAYNIFPIFIIGLFITGVYIVFQMIDKNTFSIPLRPYRNFVTVLIIPIIILLAVPDYKTIVTIAAIELGHEVLISDEFKLLLDNYISTAGVAK